MTSLAIFTASIWMAISPLGYGSNNSPTASAFLDSAMASNTVYAVIDASRSPIDFGEGDDKTNEIKVDFADFLRMYFGKKIDPRAHGLGSVFIHELAHVHPQANGQTLRDPLTDELKKTQTGDTVDFVNRIHAERGIPWRGPAYAGWPSARGGMLINFTHVDPQRPNKIYWLRARPYSR